MATIFYLKERVKISILTTIVTFILVGGSVVVEILSQLVFPGLLGLCITLGILLGFIPLVLLRPGIITKPIFTWSKKLEKGVDSSGHEIQIWIFIQIFLLVIAVATLGIFAITSSEATYNLFWLIMFSSWIILVFRKRINTWLIKKVLDEKYKPDKSD